MDHTVWTRMRVESNTLDSSSFKQRVFKGWTVTSYVFPQVKCSTCSDGFRSSGWSDDCRSWKHKVSALHLLLTQNMLLLKKRPDTWGLSSDVRWNLTVSLSVCSRETKNKQTSPLSAMWFNTSHWRCVKSLSDPGRGFSPKLLFSRQNPDHVCGLHDLCPLLWPLSTWKK